jgi:hypothetical protein
LVYGINEGSVDGVKDGCWDGIVDASDDGASLRLKLVGTEDGLPDDIDGTKDVDAGLFSMLNVDFDL